MLPLLLGAAVAAPQMPDAPRLAVVISIDQLRADYLTRYADLYLPPTTGRRVGGFRFLTSKGANFINARYTHVPTYTGPGHAIICTGSSPRLTGIVENDWYSRALKRSYYCVEDPAATDVVTGRKPSFSARTLLVSTVADELELATNGRSRTVGIALKDRASILMAGHAADEVVWFDRRSGGWTTSDYYAKNMRLPAWAAQINSERLPDKDKGREWEPALPPSAHERAVPTSKPGGANTFGASFPHTIPTGDAFYDIWTRTPWAQAWVLESAQRAVAANEMGRDPVPDILHINLSTTDYLGHWFGPYSPEAMELAVATDRQLSRLFNYLAENVTGGLDSVAIVLTADHGVLPVPEDLAQRGIPGERISMAKLRDDLRARIRARYQREDLIAHVSEFMIYLDRAALASAGLSQRDAEEAVRDELLALPQVHAAYTRSALEKGVNPSDMLAKMVAKSFHPTISGDVLYFMNPGVLPDFGSGNGTSHGTPWAYDTAVPVVIFGRHMEPGRHLYQCGPEDIAPTLAAILGIVPPSGNIGRAVGLRR